MDLSAASTIFSGISAAFKFADFAIRLAEVGSENEVFVRTIQVVRNDLHEVERLLQVKVVQQKLISVPAKFSWIRSAITSTKKALHEIGKWVERARVDQEAIGSVKFETRVRWVFNDHEKLLNRKTELFICHQQLSNVLSFLVPLEKIPATSEPPTYHDVVRFEDLLSPHSLRQAKSYTSISQRRSADEYRYVSLHAIHRMGGVIFVSAASADSRAALHRPCKQNSAGLQNQKHLQQHLLVHMSIGQRLHPPMYPHFPQRRPSLERSRAHSPIAHTWKQDQSTI